GWRLLRSGFRRSYAHAQDAYRDARRSTGDPKLFHEWRKRTKDLRYNLDLIDRAESKRQADRLHHLADILGAEHDLEVLRCSVCKSPTPQARHFAGRIAALQAKSRRTALQSGGRLFSKKPNAFVRSVHRSWKMLRNGRS